MKKDNAIAGAALILVVAYVGVVLAIIGGAALIIKAVFF